MPSKKKSTTDVSKLLPPIPGYIYDCIDKKTSLSKIKDKAVALSLLCGNEAEDLTQAISSWPDNISLLAQFKYKEPSSPEWEQLVTFSLIISKCLL